MELQDLEARVLQTWAERRAQYLEDVELQQLQRELEQAEHWLNTYESALRAEEYGVRLSHTHTHADVFIYTKTLGTNALGDLKRSVGFGKMYCLHMQTALDFLCVYLFLSGTGLCFRCSGVDEETRGSGSHDSSSEREI